MAAHPASVEPLETGDPNYLPKDGDAAFLDPGTPIYEVKGHPTSEVLASRRNRQILRYSGFAPVR